MESEDQLHAHQSAGYSQGSRRNKGLWTITAHEVADIGLRNRRAKMRTAIVTGVAAAFINFNSTGLLAADLDS